MVASNDEMSHGIRGYPWVLRRSRERPVQGQPEYHGRPRDPDVGTPTNLRPGMVVRRPRIGDSGAEGFQGEKCRGPSHNLVSGRGRKRPSIHEQLPPSRGNRVSRAGRERPLLQMHLPRVDLQHEGRLVALPSEESYAGCLDRGERSLVQRRYESYRGFVRLHVQSECVVTHRLSRGAKRYLDLIADQSDVGMRAGLREP